MQEIKGYDQWKTSGHPWDGPDEEESEEMGDNWQDIGTHVNDVAAEIAEQNQILRAICLELRAGRLMWSGYTIGQPGNNAAGMWPAQDAANAATAEVERMFSGAEKGEE